MLMQKLRKRQQTVQQKLVRHCKNTLFVYTHQCLVLLAFNLCQLFALQQKLKSQGLFSNDPAQHSFCFLTGTSCHFLQADRDHRIFPHMPVTKFFFFRDLKPCKKLLITAELKKVSQHVHI